MTTQTSIERARLLVPVLLFSLVTTLVVLAPGLPALGASGGAAELAACRVAGPLDAGVLPGKVARTACDLRGRTLTDHGVGATVPAASMGVTASAELPGGIQTLTITSNADGSITLDDVGDDAQAGIVATAATGSGGTPCKSCPKACNDKTYSLEGYALPPSETFDWYFNMGTTPGNLTAVQAEAAVVSATANVANQKNSCGMPDRVSLSTNYLGDTTEGANISQNLNCLNNDGTSVMDFGSLQAPAAAINCSWSMTASGIDDLVEADIRIDDNSNWTIDIGNGCNNAYDLQGIATHERGHTFGIAHVGAAHGNLTMSIFGLPECSKTYRTWGRGDVKGLRQLY